MINLSFIIKKETKKHISKFFDWIIHMIGYALILITASVIFKKSFYIDSNYYGLWGLIAAILIYILNKTAKPIIFRLTIPITGLTLGLFYPVINFIILKIVSLILQQHFIFIGILTGIAISIFISIMNIIMDKLIIEPLLGKE